MNRNLYGRQQTHTHDEYIYIVPQRSTVSLSANQPSASGNTTLLFSLKSSSGVTWRVPELNSFIEFLCFKMRHLTDLLRRMFLEDPVSRSKGDEHPNTWHHDAQKPPQEWWFSMVVTQHSCWTLEVCLNKDVYFWSLLILYFTWWCAFWDDGWI